MRWLGAVIRGAKTDQGATAILVALLMTVLLGAMGLAIDVGASVAKKQQLQNGADAAAFALAQEYGFDDHPCSAAAASGDADAWVSANVNKEAAAANGVVDCTGLKANELRVVADATQQHWFTPLVGINESEIRAAATVEFGVPGLATASPITIANCAFLTEDGDEPNLGEEIVIWLPGPSGDNGIDPDDPTDCSWHGDYPPGGFGVVQHDPATCSVTVTPPITLHSAPGGSQFDSPCLARAVQPGVTTMIPLFGNSTGGGKNGTYEIVRFAAMEISAINLNNPYYGSPKCPTGGSKPDWTWSHGKMCLIGTFVEFVSLQDYEGELGSPGEEDTVLIVRLTE